MLVTLNLVMARQVVVMNKEYRNSIECYLLTLHHAEKMLSMGILTLDDYAKIDTITAEKYSLSLCSIYRPNSLINSHFSGNM